MRVVLWLLAGLAALLVLFTLALALSGEQGAFRGAVDGTLEDMLLGDLPAPRGERLVTLTEPYLISVDLLEPDASGSNGFRYSSGFLSRETSVLRRPVPDALSWLLSAWKGELRMQAPGWEHTPVDVHVRSYEGLLPSLSGVDSMEAMRRAGAQAVASAFGLSIEVSTLEKQLPVLVAGPRFEQLLQQGDGEGHSSRITTGAGRLDVSGVPRALLVQHLERHLRDVQLRLPLDDGRPCSVSLRWDPDDPVSLQQELERELDLVLSQELGEVPLYVVSGPAGPGGG